MDRNTTICTTDNNETSTNYNIDYPVYFITGGVNLAEATDVDLENSLSQLETIDIELCSSDDDMSLSEYDVFQECESETRIDLMTVKITTKQQFEMLIEKMEANPNLSHGMRLFGETEDTTDDEVWKGIAENLNSYGPPKLTPDEWQRLWIHYKAKLKKKIAENNRNLNITVGGPSQEVSLSPLEHSAADLFDLTVNTVDNIFGLVRTLDVGKLIEIEPYIETEQQQVDKQIKLDNLRHTPRKTVKTEDRKFGLLKEQTANQNEILNTLKTIEKHLYKRNEIMKEIRDLKRKKYDLLKVMIEMKKKKYEALAEEQLLNQKIKRTKLEVLQKLLESLYSGNV